MLPGFTHHERDDVLRAALRDSAAVLLLMAQTPCAAESFIAAAMVLQCGVGWGARRRVSSRNLPKAVESKNEEGYERFDTCTMQSDGKKLGSELNGVSG